MASKMDFKTVQTDNENLEENQKAQAKDYTEIRNCCNCDCNNWSMLSIVERLAYLFEV